MLNRTRDNMPGSTYPFHCAHAAFNFYLSWRLKLLPSSILSISIIPIVDLEQDSIHVYALDVQAFTRLKILNNDGSIGLIYILNGL
jgi:hypothetical protein